MGQLDSILDTTVVTDFDEPFIVDAKTREIKNPNKHNRILMQNDHESERISFEIPRFVEGRDLALCNVVQIYYINIDAKSRKDATGVYTVEDLKVYPYTTDILTCSWLVSQNATKYEGTLSFMLRFATVGDNGVVTYNWSTRPFKGIEIVESLDSAETFEFEYIDIIQQWKNSVMEELNLYVDETVKGHVNVTQIEVNKLNISELIREQAVQKARMDTFTELGEGATTGDAELADIRIDMFGTAHTNAGDATREQSAVLDSVKQNKYGSFVPLEGTLHENVVYEVVSKVEQAIDGGYYGEYDVSNMNILLLSGFAWSSFNVFPLAAFYDIDGKLLKKFGNTESKSFERVLCYVPTNAVRMVINGKKWYEPAVEKFVAGDLESDIKHIQSVLSADISVSKLKNYGERDRVERVIELTADNTELLEAKMYKDNGELTTGVLSGATYDTLYFPVGIYTSFVLDKYAIGVYGGAFVDAEKKWISSFKTDYPNNLEEKVVPEGAYYIAITVNSLVRYKTINGYFKSFELDGLVLDTKNVSGPWAGKKVVWIGTSVPFGQYATKSYAKEAADRLGFNLVNCSSPGVAIHTNNEGGTMTYGSLSLSKSEYASVGWTIPNEPVKYVPGGSYNDYYRTYENVFSEENADADLYVFDVVPNNTNFDTKDWDAFDFSNWCYKDGSKFEDHRTTFLGALLFLMDKMYELNENARMIFVLGSGFSYGNGLQALTTVRYKWNIPVIDVWGKMNISPKSLRKIFSEDGTNGHPSTYAHELMGRMLAHDLEGVC